MRGRLVARLAGSRWGRWAVDAFERVAGAYVVSFVAFVTLDQAGTLDWSVVRSAAVAALPAALTAVKTLVASRVGNGDDGSLLSSSTQLELLAHGTPAPIPAVPGSFTGQTVTTAATGLPSAMNVWTGVPSGPVPVADPPADPTVPPQPPVGV